MSTDVVVPRFSLPWVVQTFSLSGFEDFSFRSPGPVEGSHSPRKLQFEPLVRSGSMKFLGQFLLGLGFGCMSYGAFFGMLQACTSKKRDIQKQATAVSSSPNDNKGPRMPPFSALQN